MSKREKPIKYGTHYRIEHYKKTWEQRCYFDGLPDEVPSEISDKAPSWKAVAICLLNNDLHLSGLGYTRPKTQYYNDIKRAELEQKGKIVKQTRLL